MEWLNYHHLHAFWSVAGAGSVTAAATTLRVSHSTLSAQVKALEAALGRAVFVRRGRGLVLTPFGHEVKAYADDIFRTGTELMDFARGRASGRPQPFDVGVVSALPRTVAYRLLRPAVAPRVPAVHLRYRQDTLDRLLFELAAGRLHVVLSDLPPSSPSTSTPVFAHLLGETGILFYASPTLARRLRRGFPQSLAGAPLLLPSTGTSLRRLLDRWFAEVGVQPLLVGEFDDAAAMRTFGREGLGVFPVRAALAAEVDDLPQVQRVGVATGVSERFYAISVERRLRHPIVSDVVDRARSHLRPDGEPRE
jgi:LysR family transcriptional regulator, transcriptional activator of nhaA